AEESPLVVNSSTIVLSEIQTRGAGGASDERIVLFNSSTEAVDITDWCVQYASASGTNFSKVFCINPSDGQATTRVFLPADTWLVAGTTDTPILKHDNVFASTMAENGKL